VGIFLYHECWEPIRSMMICLYRTRATEVQMEVAVLASGACIPTRARVPLRNPDSIPYIHFCRDLYAAAFPFRTNRGPPAYHG